MESMMKHKYIWAAAAIVALVVGYMLWSGRAYAADLGGNCCADLEERIAELEATAARKGNRKVKLTIYGTVNKAMMLNDGIDGSVTEQDYNNGAKAGLPDKTTFSGSSNQRVIDNSNDPSLVGFKGEAKINGDTTAGFVIEVGVGGHDQGGTNEVYTHRSFLYIKSAKLGAISLGHQYQASDNMDKITTANTSVAATPLSLRPLIGPQTGEVLDWADGTRADLIRYDSPVVQGFMLSASWSPSGGAADDTWDVALRYANTVGDFKLAGGASYRRGVVINAAGASLSPALLDDMKTITAVASVMHVPSGIFLTGTYADADGTVCVLFCPGLPAFALDLKGWAVTGGIEQRAVDLGKTTFFGEWGDMDGDSNRSISCGGGCTWENTNTLEVQYYGVGVVQSIDAAAMDIYIHARWYDVDFSNKFGPTDAAGFDGSTLAVEADTVVGTVGARIKF